MGHSPALCWLRGGGGCLGDLCAFTTSLTPPPTQEKVVLPDSFFLVDVVPAFVVWRKGLKGMDLSVAIILVGLA